jgi:hypothetical protein
VRERLVGLGHLVHVLAPLHRGACPVGGVHDLGDEAFGHGILAARPTEVDQPAHGQGGAALRLHLDRHLIRGATDAPRLHFEERTDVLDRSLERDRRVVRRLLADLLERVVDDVLSHRLLPTQEDPIDQLRDQGVLVYRIRLDRTAYGRAFPGHAYSPPFFAP